VQFRQIYRGGGVGLACCMLANGLERLLERSEKPPSVEITMALGPVGVLPGALILDSSRAMRCAAWEYWRIVLRWSVFRFTKVC